MTDMRRSARLTSDEVAQVLRRAAAIDAAEDADGRNDGFEPAAVEEAAVEVGLSPAAVRQAVAELRVGAIPAEIEPSRRARTQALTSRAVCHQRLVTSSPDAVHAKVDRFMRTQMFELRRRSGDRSVYRERSDLIASVRRGLNFAGAIKLEGLRTIDLVVTPADDRTLVRLEAELASSRVGAVAGGAAAGTAVTVATGLAGALLAEPVLVIGALPAGAAVGAGGIRVAGDRWRKRRDDMAEVLASLLDRL